MSAPEDAGRTPEGPWVARGSWIYPDTSDLSALAGIAQCRTRLHGPSIRKKEAEANARYIVRAVNSHDALVSALDELIEAEWMVTPTWDHSSKRDPLLDRMRAVLEKAKAE